MVKNGSVEGRDIISESGTRLRGCEPRRALDFLGLRVPLCFA